MEMKENSNHYLTHFTAANTTFLTADIHVVHQTMGLVNSYQTG